MNFCWRFILVLALVSVLSLGNRLRAEEELAPAFKEFFCHPPPALECCAQFEFGPNVFYARLCYGQGNLMVRKEKTLAALEQREFSTNTYIAGHDERIYWSASPTPSGESKIYVVDTNSLDYMLAPSNILIIDTDFATGRGVTNHYTARRYLEGVETSAQVPLSGLFCGLPIWDCRTVVWSNNTLYATSPPGLNIVATMLDITNGCPGSAVVRMAGTSYSFWLVNDFSNTFQIQYQYDAKPPARGLPRLPVVYRFVSAAGKVIGSIRVVSLQTAPTPFAPYVWRYDEYLNSATTAIDVVTNMTRKIVKYSDRTEGRVRIWGVRLARKHVAPVVLAVIIAFGLITFLTVRWLLLPAFKKS